MTRVGSQRHSKNNYTHIIQFHLCHTVNIYSNWLQEQFCNLFLYTLYILSVHSVYTVCAINLFEQKAIHSDTVWLVRPFSKTLIQPNSHNSSAQLLLPPLLTPFPQPPEHTNLPYVSLILANWTASVPLTHWRINYPCCDVTALWRFTENSRFKQTLRYLNLSWNNRGRPPVRSMKT